MPPLFRSLLLAILPPALAAAAPSLENTRYQVAVQNDGSVHIATAGVPTQVLQPEFVVMFSARDPGYHRNHLNYPLAPRTAIRWANYEPELAELNRGLASPEVRQATQSEVTVTADAAHERTWTYRDASGKVTYRFSGPYARGTIDPFLAGTRTNLRARAATVVDRTVRWEFDSPPGFAFRAELTLPAGDADPQITHTLTAAEAGHYAVAFVGAPALPVLALQTIPQECAGRGHRQFNHLVCEGELQLPRAQLSTGNWNLALVVDAREAPFRIPTQANSRFGLMLEHAGGQLRPVAFAPIMGGAESKLAPGAAREFRLHFVLQPGDWKEIYRTIARTHYGFRDQRDNSGPGSINRAIENTIDYLVDRHGRNHAMWHAEQKYYDYWTDNSGIFKPFSPLFGLAAAVVTDDEDFYRRRALPQVEFTLSRRSNIFAPYEVENNGQVKSRNRELGEAYLGAAQLVSLASFFQNRTPAILAQAERKGFAPSDLAAQLARFQLTGDPAELARAKAAAEAQLRRAKPMGGDDYMDFLDLHEATRDPRYLAAAVEGAYGLSTTLNLSPAVPDATVTADAGGHSPVHDHSTGRHKRWGFPPPQPFPTPEQTVPAWRIALTGLQSQGYRGEFWMNHHGQLMRLAALAQDDFLRDLARWGMVGRFGTYAGDNRSKNSLVIERPDAVEHPIWDLNYATVNPGHAWEFVGELLDFLVSDVFHRSAQRIDFPAQSLPGSSFRVRVYGDRPGRFYGDDNVRLWLPRQLLTLANRQIDYVAAYAHDQVYVALLNQSFVAEEVNATLNPALVALRDTHAARRWVQNGPPENVRVEGGRLVCRIQAKGIVAFAIAGARARTALHAKLFDPSAPRLGPRSFTQIAAPFGQVHALLLSPGRGLTSAFVYTDALPENTISATLRYRQGTAGWRTLTDAIFPYEFSPEYREGAGDLQLEFAVETSRQEVQRAPLISLSP
jgi:hypothetical protein